MNTTISQIPMMADKTPINSITVTIDKAWPAETTGQGKQKQNFVVTDETGQTNLTCWGMAPNWQQGTVVTLNSVPGNKGLRGVSVNIYNNKHKIQIDENAQVFVNGQQQSYVNQAPVQQQQPMQQQAPAQQYQQQPPVQQPPQQQYQQPAQAPMQQTPPVQNPPVQQQPTQQTENSSKFVSTDSFINKQLHLFITAGQKAKDRGMTAEQADAFAFKIMEIYPLSWFGATEKVGHMPE